jgi:hypothetical protein
VVAGIAWFGFDRRPAPPLDAYRRLGPEAGAAALRRDLLAAHPTGTAPEPLIQLLEAMGLGCRATAEGWACTRTAQAAGRRVWRIEVTFGLANGTLGTLGARMAEEMP